MKLQNIRHVSLILHQVAKYGFVSFFLSLTCMRLCVQTDTELHVSKGHLDALQIHLSNKDF